MTLRLVSRLAALAALAALTTPPATASTPIAGIPATNVGVHGPVADELQGLEIVARVPMRPAGDPFEGLGNNGAPALVGDCAYVGRWHDYRDAANRPQRGVQIVDVDPASSAYATVVGEVADSYVRGATSREIRAVDLPAFKLLVVMTFSDALTNRPDRKLNTLRFFDATDCRNPVLVGMHDLLASVPHEFFLWVDPDRSHDVSGRPRILVYVTVPIQTPNLVVVDATDPSRPRLVAAFDAAAPVVSPEEPSATFLGNYAHSVSVSADGTRAYLSYWDAGFLTVDTTALARGLPAGAIAPLGLAGVPYDYSPPDVGNTHSAVEIPGAGVAVVGDEVFGGTIGACPYGWMRTVAIGSATERPHQIGEFRLDVNRAATCDRETGLPALRNANGDRPDGTFSMHNQTVTGRYVLASWYGAGMRVVDVADPAHPVEAGAFVPAPLRSVRTPSITRPVTPQGKTGSQDDDWWVETWSYPVVRDGLIYVTDIRNGLTILRPSPDAPFAAEIAATRFAEGNSNLGAVLGR